MLVTSRALAVTRIFFMLMLAGECINGNYINCKVIDQVSASELETKKEVLPSGSILPDCSHACEACFPCKRVMVSFKCSIAESCPIVYRCVCKGKYYHVPSN